jgi:hypothetical protein
MLASASDRNRSEKIEQYKRMTQVHIAATQRIDLLQKLISHNLATIEYAFIQNSMRMDTCDMEGVEVRELTEMCEESENFKNMLDYLEGNLEFMIRKCKFEEVEISETHI